MQSRLPARTPTSFRAVACWLQHVDLKLTKLRSVLSLDREKSPENYFGVLLSALEIAL